MLEAFEITKQLALVLLAKIHHREDDDALFEDSLARMPGPLQRKLPLRRGHAAEPRPQFDIGLDMHRLIERLDLLSGLDERQLDRVARLLRPRFTVPNERIIRKGDRGDAVFFIVSGAVEVALPAGPVRLGSGEFFGEMALLSGRPRQADITALSYCRLLVLRKADFEHFMTANPEAREAINRVAASRQSMNQEDRDRAAEAASL